MTNTVRIIETPETDGWLLAWSPEDTERHGTAMSALLAVRERDRVLAQASLVVVTTISWEPKSAVGRHVVHAITGAKPE